MHPRMRWSKTCCDSRFKNTVLFLFLCKESRKKKVLQKGIHLEVSLKKYIQTFFLCARNCTWLLFTFRRVVARGEHSSVRNRLKPPAVFNAGRKKDVVFVRVRLNLAVTMKHLAHGHSDNTPDARLFFPNSESERQGTYNILSSVLLDSVIVKTYMYILYAAF